MKRTVGAVAVGIAILVASACDSANSTPSPSTTGPSLSAPNSTTTTANPVVAAQEGALAAYRGMWAAYQEAGKTANPDDPALNMFATDGALQTLVTGLKSVRGRELVIKGEIVLSPKVTSMSPADSPTEVEIRDCADDSKSLLYKRSGELYNDKPGGRRVVIATVKHLGGGWKVASFGAQGVGTC